MWLSIISLVIALVYGWIFYQAIMHQVAWCALVCAVSFGLYEGDRFYKSEIVRGFVAGIKGETNEKD